MGSIWCWQLLSHKVRIYDRGVSRAKKEKGEKKRRPKLGKVDRYPTGKRCREKKTQQPPTYARCSCSCTSRCCSRPGASSSQLPPKGKNRFIPILRAQKINCSPHQSAREMLQQPRETNNGLLAMYYYSRRLCVFTSWAIFSCRNVSSELNFFFFSLLPTYFSSLFIFHHNFGFLTPLRISVAELVKPRTGENLSVCE